MAALHKSSFGAGRELSPVGFCGRQRAFLADSASVKSVIEGFGEISGLMHLFGDFPISPDVLYLSLNWIGSIGESLAAISAATLNGNSRHGPNRWLSGC
jgi:hypothetical protein